MHNIILMTVSHRLQHLRDDPRRISFIKILSFNDLVKQLATSYQPKPSNRLFPYSETI